MRRRKPKNLLINDTPIGGKRPPIEIVQTYPATFFRHEAYADNKAIRLPNKQFSLCASPHRSISPYQLCSDKMLFSEKLHKCLRDYVSFAEVEAGLVSKRLAANPRCFQVTVCL
jgi:hypothetical protein